MIRREIGVEFEFHADFVRNALIDDGQESKRRREIIRASIMHQRKLTRGRAEGDRSIDVEVIQIRHLVEVAIVEDDARVIASTASALASDGHVLGERHLDLCIFSLQEISHLNVSVDLRRHHVPVRIERHAHLFDDIDENFIPSRRARPAHHALLRRAARYPIHPARHRRRVHQINRRLRRKINLHS